MSGIRGQAHAREDAANLCDSCGQFGWRTNPVRRDKDGRYLHTRCRARLLEGASR